MTQAALQQAAGTERGARVGPVSVVVVNYEGERYLPPCLDALLAATDEGIDEILVVDNASTDGSLALLAERYPGVRVIEMGDNAGPAKARNAGMRAARNRWVLAVDNDAIVTPGMLTKLRAAADARPDAAIVQPRSVFAAEPDRVHYDGGGLHYAGLIALRNWYEPLASARGSGAIEVDVCIAVCLLVDTEVVLALGAYDEVYFILFEDLDLSCRLRLAGHAILSVEDALVHHDAGTAGISFREGKSYPSSRVFYHSRNRWLYMLKCYGWWTLLLALPGVLLYELVWLAFAVVQGGLGAWLRGKWAVVTGLGAVLEKRRSARAGRRVRDRALFVGGPWTVTPALAEGASGVVIRAVDGLLRAWWAVARLLVS
ncbi:MAG: glycosyltransferase family 2 protein [bacterium]|nr:glycosyltransferase family 2 protein [bacterium]